MTTTDTTTAVRRAWEQRTGWTVTDRPTGCLLHAIHAEHDECPTSYPRSFDHVHVIRYETGNPALLLMPYTIFSDDADQLTEWCEHLALDWHTEGGGWWNEATIAIVVTKGGADK